MSLKAWQNARRLAGDCARAARLLPRDERGVLGLHLRQSAYTTLGKIAAGCVSTGAQRLEAFDAARRALAEVEAALSVARELGYLPTGDYARLEAWCAETAKTLYGLRRRVRGDGGVRQRPDRP